MKRLWKYFINNFRLEKAEKWITVFFFCISIFVIFLLTQTLILTWINQFKLLYVSFFTLTSFLLTIIFFFFIKKDVKFLPSLNIPVLLIISLVCLIFIVFPHDTFGGRDEGLYANLAIYLTNNGNLNTPLYLNPNPTIIQSWAGRVPAYTTWLAIQNIFFGQNWMLSSSVIPVALGLIYLYLVASFFGGKKVGLITLILHTSSLPFLWLARETLSENLAFFLLWFLVLFLILFFKTKRNIYLSSLFITSWLFAFTRAEGLFIQITMLLVFVLIVLITRVTSVRKTIFIALIYLFLIASTFLTLDYQSNKAYLSTNVSDVKFAVTRDLSSISVKKNINIKLIDRIPIFLMQMMAKYNLLLVLYSIILVIPIIVTDKKNCLKNKIYFIGLLIIISPEFVKLINPGISFDQPWLYRRYIYALIPLGYFCLSFLLYKTIKRKSLLLLIIIILFIINIVLASKIITLKNNWLLTKKIERLTKSITRNDLVIIENRYLFNYYYPAIYFSYQKEILSLYPDQLETANNHWLPKEKIFNDVLYNKLFLLSGEEFNKYKDFKLIKIDNEEIEYQQLQWICDFALLQKSIEPRIDNYLFFPYQDVINYCSKRENEIINSKKKVFLYELIYEKELYSTE